MALPARLRRKVFDLRTEGSGPGREAAAIGLGAFIGCTPFYGFHLLMCWAAGSLLRLNRLKLYLAANISNPLIAPFLIFAEVQTGTWLRRGSFRAVTLEELQSLNPWIFGLDLLVGSGVIGGVLGVAVASTTYATLRGSGDDEGFIEIVRRASERYVALSITAWEFARGKLRGDPVYRAALCGRLLPSGSVLLDVGCGQGLMLALLAEAQRAVGGGDWPPGLPAPPRFDRLMGVELRPRIAALAQRALGSDADIVEGDARAHGCAGCRAILLFDVLHMMAPTAQEALLGDLAAVLEPGGVILIREADASAGWRFTAVRVGNRLKALAFGAWRQQFHFRSVEEWLACFARLGLVARIEPLGRGTPFANVLFRVTREVPGSENDGG